MKRLSILLAVFLFISSFVVSTTHVQAADAGLVYTGSSGTTSPGLFGAGSSDSSGTGTIGVQIYYEQGSDAGTDNPQPGTDNGPGSIKSSPSGMGSRC